MSAVIAAGGGLVLPSLCFCIFLEATTALTSLVQSEGIVDLCDMPALTMCLRNPHYALGCAWDLHAYTA